VMTVPHTLERWRLQWRQRPRREQRIIIALTMLVVVSLLWLWLWLPLTQHLQQLQRELPLARAQLEQAQRQLNETIGLGRQTSLPATADAQAAIQRTAARFNIAAAIVTLDIKQNSGQNTAALTFSAVPFDTLAHWLDILQREEHFYVTAATLTPLTGAAGGQLRAELILVRPSP